MPPSLHLKQRIQHRSTRSRSDDRSSLGEFLLGGPVWIAFLNSVGIDKPGKPPANEHASGVPFDSATLEAYGTWLGKQGGGSADRIRRVQTSPGQRQGVGPRDSGTHPAKGRLGDVPYARDARSRHREQSPLSGDPASCAEAS